MRLMEPLGEEMIMKEVIYILYAITPVVGIIASTFLAINAPSELWGGPMLIGGIVGVLCYGIKNTS